MRNVTHFGHTAAGSPVFEIHLACGAAGENYALETVSTLARASEKMNTCQQGAATRLLVGG